MAVRWSRLYRSTASELALEDAVAALGVPYRGQFPGFLYGSRAFPDFVLPTLGIVIEVDDPSHDRLAKRIADAERTSAIEDNFGWRVVRCTNEEATNDPHGTVRRLLGSVGMWPIPRGLPKMADAMPALKRAPKKERREAKSAARQRRRKAGFHSVSR